MVEMLMDFELFGNREVEDSDVLLKLSLTTRQAVPA